MDAPAHTAGTRSGRPLPVETSLTEMERVFVEQREAFRRFGAPTAVQRIDRLERAIALVKDYSDQICEAVSADFGSRSMHQSLVSDVISVVTSLNYAKARVRRWMRPERRLLEFPWDFLGARGEVRYEPLGVVGVVSPWNFPVNLCLAPLAGILAAGNSALLKPSEETPATSALIGRMIRQGFDRTEAFVVQGGPVIASAFTRLPFDHLLFTGSARIAAKVLRAAAENLVPVTLELGGKSPVIVGQGADLDAAASRILFAKTLNAGQICLAPDYVLVPEGLVEPFAEAALRAVAAQYPSLKENPDYTSIINGRHYERLRGLLSEAVARGARIVEINPAKEDFAQQTAHKMPPTLILEPADDLGVMREEIFGPLLPVKSYRTLDEALDRIAEGPKPLALYYFGTDKRQIAKVLARSESGGVTINDVAQHVVHETLPFGGVGQSGMGRYHGRDGFRNFSHMRAVYYQTDWDLLKFIRAPYNRETLQKLKRFIGR